jgi:uncharacterized protein with HEPN domain
MSKDPLEYLRHINDECLYMGINYSIVWDVIINKIPELSKQVIDVLENEQKYR